MSPPVRSLPPGLACCGAAGPEGGFGAVSGSFGAQQPPPSPASLRPTPSRSASQAGSGVVAWAESEPGAACWGCLCCRSAPRAASPTWQPSARAASSKCFYFQPQTRSRGVQVAPEPTNPTPRWLWSPQPHSCMALGTAINVVVLFQGLLCSWLPPSPASEIFVVSSPCPPFSSPFSSPPRLQQPGGCPSDLHQLQAPLCRCLAVSLGPQPSS